jgi:hypothetical protein
MGSSPYCLRGCIEHDKNLHGSKTIPKSRYKVFCFGITEIEMLPHCTDSPYPTMLQGSDPEGEGG